MNIHTVAAGRNTATVLLVFLSILASTKILFANEYVLNMPSEFVPARDKQGQVQVIKAEEIEKIFRDKSKNLRDFYHNKNIRKYIVADNAWIKDMLGVLQDYIWKLGLHWESESWDCDNYSMLLNSFTTIRMWKAGYTSERCALGWMIVNGKYAWAGMPAKTHALVFAYTSKGLIVIEPQNGKTIAFKDYPNNNYVKQVFLF